MGSLGGSSVVVVEDPAVDGIMDADNSAGTNGGDCDCDTKPGEFGVL